MFWVWLRILLLSWPTFASSVPLIYGKLCAPFHRELYRGVCTHCSQNTNRPWGEWQPLCMKVCSSLSLTAVIIKKRNQLPAHNSKPVHLPKGSLSTLLIPCVCLTRDWMNEYKKWKRNFFPCEKKITESKLLLAKEIKSKLKWASSKNDKWKPWLYTDTVQFYGRQTRTYKEAEQQRSGSCCFCSSRPGSLLFGSNGRHCRHMHETHSRTVKINIK